jgi:hypothetical protein
MNKNYKPPYYISAYDSEIPLKGDRVGYEIVAIPDKDIGKVSDGYHTFDELYDHRAKLFSVIVNTYDYLSWKSRKHSDGTMFDPDPVDGEYFIVGIETPNGHATYHYTMKYWDLFQCPEIHYAPEYDGHTSNDAIERVLTTK